MRLPLSYTPPDLQAERPGTVRRRHVFFIPGYDPEARTRYRLLFVRELLRHAKRFGDPRPDISPAVLSPDGLVQSWTVGPGRDPGRAATSYDVLLWDDLVARDFRRPRVLSVLLLVVGTLHALLRGLIFRFYRLNWLYGNVVIYPFVMVVLLTALSAAIGTMVHAHLGDWFGHSLGWPPWVTLPLAVVAGIAWIVAIEALLNRFFFWQLLNDWVFNWQHGNGWRRDYAERLEVFADRVLAQIAEAEARGERPDEVMIVGHSTGGLTAAEPADEAREWAWLFGVATNLLRRHRRDQRHTLQIAAIVATRLQFGGAQLLRDISGGTVIFGGARFAPLHIVGGKERDMRTHRRLVRGQWYGLGERPRRGKQQRER